MKIYVCPADAFGCGHYRLVWPAEVAARYPDVQVVVIPPGSSSGIGGTVMIDPTTGKRSVVGVTAPEDADLIVLQRVTNAILADAVEALVQQGVPVVIDMDDDLSAIDPSNPAFSMLHPNANPHDNWQHAARACRAATMVTVTTPALAERYASHERVALLPNCVPAGFLEWERNDDGSDEPTVAWAGSVQSHPRDLQVAAAGLRASGLPFRVVGPEAGIERALGIRPVDATGSVPFNEWSRALSQMQVGIAPLADTRFNRGKSWLKPLEMSACGVPWVASPTVEYERLHRQGVGLLAGRPREWTAALNRLRDPSFRAEQSEAGREVAAQWTYQANVWRWLEAWEAAVTATRRVRSRARISLN